MSGDRREKQQQVRALLDELFVHTRTDFSRACGLAPPPRSRSPRGRILQRSSRASGSTKLAGLVWWVGGKNFPPFRSLTGNGNRQSTHDLHRKAGWVASEFIAKPGQSGMCDCGSQRRAKNAHITCALRRWVGGRHLTTIWQSPCPTELIHSTTCHLPTAVHPDPLFRMTQ